MIPRGRCCRRRQRARKNDKRLEKINNARGYARPGYLLESFEGRTLLHSGVYIHRHKSSAGHRWAKRYTSKKVRGYMDLPPKGNQYRKVFDYWWAFY